MAATDGRWRISLSTTGLSLSGRMALSADEAKLALTAEPESVVIFFLESEETFTVTESGYVSGWSLDGERLYYQDTRGIASGYGLRVYDLSRDVNTEVLSSSLRTTEGMTVTLPLGIEVSPLENAAVFHKNSGIWLVTWTPAQVAVSSCD